MALYPRLHPNIPPNIHPAYVCPPHHGPALADILLCLRASAVSRPRTLLCMRPALTDILRLFSVLCPA
eukprot:1161530-Pelagomonas_calceolata.AAC.2